MARYDRGYRSGYDLRPTAWGGYYPPTYIGGGPWYGLAGGGWAPYAPYALPWGEYTDVGPGYGYDYTPRRRPEESPTYGRGGDRELRRWARAHGYDAGYAIRPRPEPRPARGRRPGRGYGRDFGFRR